MTVSSIFKEDFYPTSELINLLAATNNLASEITLNWIGAKDDPFYCRVMENLEVIKESLSLHFKEFYTIELALMVAASSQLTEKQKKLLIWLAMDYREKVVYTVLIERLSKELGIPKSTIRWNLKGLREAGFIVAGDKNTKGLPVELSEMGQTLADYLIT